MVPQRRRCGIQQFQQCISTDGKSQRAAVGMPASVVIFDDPEFGGFALCVGCTGNRCSARKNGILVALWQTNMRYYAPGKGGGPLLNRLHSRERSVNPDCRILPVRTLKKTPAGGGITRRRQTQEKHYSNDLRCSRNAHGTVPQAPHTSQNQRRSTMCNARARASKLKSRLCGRMDTGS
jgi:hypothetical protein